MQFGDALNDGKSKAGIAGLPAIAPPEALKDQFAFAFGDAEPVVLNARIRSLILI
jgi:hypothetical protein